jgi:hypothetical protein
VDHQNALLLVGLEHEMRCRREHALYRRQLLRYERRQLAKIVPLHHHKQVITPGHQIAGTHLGVFGDPLRQSVKTTPTLGRDLHLNHRPNHVHPQFLLVEDGSVSKDDPFGSSYPLIFRVTSSSGRLSIADNCEVFSAAFSRSSVKSESMRRC